MGRFWQPESFGASPELQREWAFTAWWSLRDAVKHARRHRVWRAITSLEVSRGLAWQLHAASLGVDYPGFGAVSVENADLPGPQGLSSTLVRTDETPEILRAAQALAGILAGLTAAHGVDGVRVAALELLR